MKALASRVGLHAVVRLRRGRGYALRLLRYARAETLDDVEAGVDNSFPVFKADRY